MRKKSGCFLLTLLCVVALYFLSVHLLAPKVIRTQIEERVAAMDLSVSVGSVNVHPLHLSTSIRDVVVNDKNGEAMVSIARLQLDPAIWASIRNRRVTAQLLELDAPSVRAVRDASGQFNLLDLKPARKPENEPAKPLPDLVVEQVAINRAKVELVDIKTGFTKNLGSIGLAMAGFQSLGTNQFTFTLDSPAASRDGDVGVEGRFHLPGRSAELMLAVSGVEIATYEPLFEPWVVPKISGLLAVGGIVAIRPAQSNTFELTLDAGILEARDLLIDDGRKTSLDDARMHGVAVDLVNKTIRVDAVSAEGFGGELVLDVARILNISKWGEIPDLTVPEQIEFGTSTWDIVVADLAVDRSLIRFTDEAVGATVPCRFSIKGTQLSTRAAPRGRVAFTAEIGEGQGSMTGTLLADGRQGSGEAEVSVVAFQPKILQPWIGLMAEATIERGTVSTTARAEFSDMLRANRSLAAEAQVNLTDWAVHHAGMPLLQWTAFGVDRVSATYPNKRLSVSGVHFEGLNAVVHREANGEWNLQKIAKVAPQKSNGADIQTTADPLASGGAEAVPRTLTLDRFSLVDGTLHFRDDTVAPSLVTRVEQLNLMVSNVVFGAEKRMGYRSSGVIEYGAPFEATGWYDDRIARFPNQQMTLKNLPLRPFSGISASLVGREIAGGAFSMKHELEVAPEHLRGEVKFLFDHLKMGEKVESPNAIKAPIGLALFALSKGGKVDQKIEIQGNPADPGFKLWPVFRHAAMNLVTKIAGSPLTFVENTFARKDWDTTPLTFVPSGREPTAGGRHRLRGFAEIMRANPALDLRIALPSGADGFPEELGGQRCLAVREVLQDKGFRPTRVLGMPMTAAEIRKLAPDVDLAYAVPAWLEPLDRGPISLEKNTQAPHTTKRPHRPLKR